MSQPYRRTVKGAVIKVKLLPVTELGLENENSKQSKAKIDLFYGTRVAIGIA